jgi:hypothetical protein
MLLSPALGGLWDEGRHGQKKRNFGKFFPKFQSLISRLLSRIEKMLKWFEEMSYSIILKQLDYF